VVSRMVDILLATYNSEQFLREQIDSILKQTNKEWRLLVRDDGSSDSTLEIIEEFAQLDPQRIHLISSSSSERAGPSSNFSALLQASTASYVMFCDHDDVWNPDKIDLSLSRMKETEASCEECVPVLVYTDLCVVDEQLSVVNPSCYKQQKINPQKIGIKNLLLQNVPTGCTMMLNRALVERVGLVPAGAVVHDHWVALVASCFGKTAYINQQTVLYRQHRDNFYGAADYGWAYFFKRGKDGLPAIRCRFYENVDQAQAFLNRYQNELSEELRAQLVQFVQLGTAGWIGRRRILIQGRIFKHGFRRNLGMFLVI